MKRSSSWVAVLPSLVIPVCLGLTMYLGLSYLIAEQHITNETILRYLTGHPVSKVTVGMFFIGLASLLMIANNIFDQFSCQKSITLDITNEEEQERVASLSPKEQAVELGKQLNTLPKTHQTHYLWHRLQNTLHTVYRSGTTKGVEEELKYQAELDLDQQQQRYSLVRILIWATPMLGFLGTVLGISQALGGINVGEGGNFQTMMDGLRGSLYIAFDTTALALTLSMLLMFCQFLVDRFESQLLILVDHRAQSEINRNLVLPVQANGHFNGEEQPLSLSALSSSLEAATLQSSEKQTEIWRKTIESAQNAWASTLTDANMQVQSNMSVAIDENVSNLAHYLGEAIEKADLAMSHRWQQWQVTLSENARLLHDHHSQLAKQTLLLHELMEKSEAKSPIAIAEQDAKLEALDLKLNQLVEDSAQSATESSNEVVGKSKKVELDTAVVTDRYPQVNLSDQTFGLKNALPQPGQPKQPVRVQVERPQFQPKPAEPVQVETDLAAAIQSESNPIETEQSGFDVVFAPVDQTKTEPVVASAPVVTSVALPTTALPTTVLPTPVSPTADVPKPAANQEVVFAQETDSVDSVATGEEEVPVFNFQAYLDSTLAKATKNKTIRPESELGNQEVVLPFKLPNEPSTEKDSAQSIIRAFKKSA